MISDCLHAIVWDGTIDEGSRFDAEVIACRLDEAGWDDEIGVDTIRLAKEIVAP